MRQRFQTFTGKAERGSAIILMLMFLVLVMLEITILGAIVSRGMGEEGILGSQNIAAQQANQTAVRRLSDDLRDYLLGGGLPANVLTDFAEGTGANAIVSQNLAAVDPETGTSAAGNVTINAWVEERRNVYYHIITKAEIGQVSLVQHQWVKLIPCTASSGGGTGLSLLLSDGKKPGVISIGADANGRIFFGEQSCCSNKFRTWKETTGLSVLASGMNYAGGYSMGVSPDGRVFFGEQTGDGDFYTWNEASGLSLIVSGLTYPGFESVAFSPAGRAYIGSINSSGKFQTWDSTDGLSIITSGDELGQDATDVADDGRVYFGQDATGGSFHTWHSATGLSIIISNIDQPGHDAIGVHGSSGRVFFGDRNGGSSRFYTWLPGGSLSVIISNVTTPGNHAIGVAQSTGRVFFGETTTSGSFWTWEVSSGLSVLYTSERYPGWYSTNVTPAGRVFFGDYDSGSGKFRTWEQSDGLSIIVSDGNIPGAIASHAVTPNGRIFFGEISDPGRMHTWHKSTGLSVILSDGDEPGNFSFPSYPYSGNERLPSKLTTERATFSTIYDGSAGDYATWEESTGLSFIISNVSYPGDDTAVVSADGSIYGFGENADPGKFWVWMAPSTGGSACNLGY
ncbi:MAG: WD40 repeat domain-containing protein [Vampirovibrio sp.]|nr:WD40 repeat domain-containing protein [Vampirovibrio sp.]